MEKNKIQKIYNIDTVYGDTDSVFLRLGMNMTLDTIQDAIDYSTSIAKSITSIFPPPIELKFEKVYWPCVLESKKRYCGYPWEKGDVKPKFEAKVFFCSS